MMNVITPKKVTGEILRFCSTISPHLPMVVPVVPEEWSSLGGCFPSVRTAVENKRGRMVTGWILWIWPRVYIEAEHHAVHEMQNGALVDVTPKSDGEEHILFLRDDTAEFDFATERARGNIRHALSSDPVILEHLAAADAMSEFVLAHTSKGLTSFENAKIAPLALRQYRASSAFLRKVIRPDSFCTCNSGLKVRRCCGMEAAVIPMINGTRMKPDQFEAALTS